MFSGFSWDMIYWILFVPFLETTSYHIANYESHHGLMIFPSYHSIPIDWSAFISRIQVFMIKSYKKSQLLDTFGEKSNGLWHKIIEFLFFRLGNPYFFGGYGGHQHHPRHPPALVTSKNKARSRLVAARPGAVRCRDAEKWSGITLWWTNIAMENGHLYCSGFSHEKWWFRNLTPCLFIHISG